MKKIFDQKGTFSACAAAEAYCESLGLSVGTPQKNKPRGLKRGDVDIYKWSTLSFVEIAQMDGRMTGDLREGPVVVDIKDDVFAAITQHKKVV